MQADKVDYPRKKNYMNDLNALLEQYQSQSAIYSKNVRIDSIKHQGRPKTMSLMRNNLQDLKAQSFKPLKINSSGNILHTRTLSNYVRCAQMSVDKNTKSSLQLRKQKMVNMLSMQNVRKQLMNTRKMSGFQYRARQAKLKQKRNQQYVLKPNLYRNKSHQNKIGQFNQNRAIDYNGQYHSSQQNQSNLIDKFNQFQMQRTLNNSKLRKQKNNASNKELVEKKQFLKKGTGINKSILNSIVKLKLGKNTNEQYHERQTEQQIVKMIKVYKGIEPVLPNSRQPKNRDQQKAAGKGKKQQIHIDGWANQTQQFDIHHNNSQSPPHAQSSQI